MFVLQYYSIIKMYCQIGSFYAVSGALSKKRMGYLVDAVISLVPKLELGNKRKSYRLHHTDNYVVNRIDPTDHV